ncbi:MAG TPA: sigma-70 family RNA polymerase sigma factor [Streptosporangiaceae bacterium]|nr:sigma-70 family RNA polymerase sigma factor [Streptosporangiaceae bacterium]
MADSETLAREFEQHRTRLRAVAYRMLGSFAEADDVVQEAWLRFSQAGTEDVDNVGAWLTTIVARLSLNALRTRRRRQEEPLEVYVPDPVISSAEGIDPEQEVLLADAVGTALDVILDTLQPAERLALVLHDMFDVPYDDIARMLAKTPAAARQLASRARHRVRDVTPPQEPDPAQSRQVVDAFFAAAHGGDLDQLISLLDPDVVLRSQGGSRRPAATALVRGPAAVADRAMMFRRPDAQLVPALINGGPGVVALVGGELFSVLSFAVAGGRVTEISALVDPDRLAKVDLSPLGL